jgi:hypothetical protein
MDEGEYTINKSFNYLINLIEKESSDIKNNNEGVEGEYFIKDYFCCKECYDKFINVIKKFKEKKVDLTKIDWGKYSSDNSNIIVKLVTYYYNLGLQNSNK